MLAFVVLVSRDFWEERLQNDLFFCDGWT